MVEPELRCKVMTEAPNASRIHIICKQSVLAACYAVDGHMGPILPVTHSCDAVDGHMGPP
jgi:hypothetical protein